MATDKRRYKLDMLIAADLELVERRTDKNLKNKAEPSAPPAPPRKFSSWIRRMSASEDERPAG